MVRFHALLVKTTRRRSMISSRRTPAPTMYFVNYDDSVPSPAVMSRYGITNGNLSPLYKIHVVTNTHFKNYGHDIYVRNLSAYIKAKIDEEYAKIADLHHVPTRKMQTLPFSLPPLIIKSKTKLSTEESEFLGEHFYTIKSNTKACNKPTLDILRLSFNITQDTPQPDSSAKYLNIRDMGDLVRISRLVNSAVLTNCYPSTSKREDAVISSNFRTAPLKRKSKRVIPKTNKRRKLGNLIYGSVMEKQSMGNQEDLDMEVDIEGVSSANEPTYSTAIEYFLPKVAKYEYNQDYEVFVHAESFDDNSKGIWFPYHSQLAQVDGVLVPQFINHYLLRNLAKTPGGQVKMMNRLSHIWRSVLCRFEYSDYINHIIKCLEIALECQGLCQIVIEKERSETKLIGCVILGEFTLVTSGIPEGISSNHRLRETIYDSSQHSIALKNIASIFSNRSEMILKSTSYSGLRRILLEDKDLFIANESTIRREAAYLNYRGVYPLERSISNVLELLNQWTDGEFSIQTGMYLNPFAIATYDEREASLGLFGNLTFSVSIKSASEHDISFFNQLLDTNKEQHLQEGFSTKTFIRWQAFTTAVRGFREYWTSGVLRMYKGKASKSFRSQSEELTYEELKILVDQLPKVRELLLGKEGSPVSQSAVKIDMNEDENPF
jgi:hypothetical protein